MIHCYVWCGAGSCFLRGSGSQNIIDFDCFGFTGLRPRVLSRVSWVTPRRIWFPLTSLVTAGIEFCFGLLLHFLVHPASRKSGDSLLYFNHHFIVSTQVEHLWCQGWNCSERALRQARLLVRQWVGLQQPCRRPDPPHVQDPVERFGLMVPIVFLVADRPTACLCRE